jgi:hypothetical protein
VGVKPGNIRLADSLVRLLERQAVILQIVGLVLNFAGSLMLFFDSWKIAKMFTRNSFSFGYGSKYDTWIWRILGRLGFGCVTLGFLVQLVGFFSFG